MDTLRKISTILTVLIFVFSTTPIRAGASPDKESANAMIGVSLPLCSKVLDSLPNALRAVLHRNGRVIISDKISRLIRSYKTDYLTFPSFKSFNQQEIEKSSKLKDPERAYAILIEITQDIEKDRLDLYSRQLNMLVFLDPHARPYVECLTDEVGKALALLPDETNFPISRERVLEALSLKEQ